jgi:hypothetical protein
METWLLHYSTLEPITVTDCRYSAVSAIPWMPAFPCENSRIIRTDSRPYGRIGRGTAWDGEPSSSHAHPRKLACWLVLFGNSYSGVDERGFDIVIQPLTHR